MKKIDIYKKLTDYINEKTGEIDILSYIQFKSELFKEAKEEVCKGSGTKTSKLNAIKRVLKASTKIRPLLTKYDIQEGKMVFTDSYEAYRITDLENNPFDRATDKDGTYPNLVNAFPKEYKEEEEIQLDKANIKALRKITKNNTKDRKENGYKINDNTSFDIYYLDNMLEIMPEDTKYYFKDNRLIYGISPSTNDDCIVLGIRIY